MFTGKKQIDPFFIAELAIIFFLIAIGLIVPAANLAALAVCAWMIVFERGVDHIFDLLFFLLPLSPVFRTNLNGFALFNIITILVFVRLFVANGFAFWFPSVSVFLIMAYVLAGLKTAGKPDVIRFCCQLMTSAVVLGIPEFRNSMSIKRKNTMLSLGITASSVLALMKSFFPKLDAYLSPLMARIKLGSGLYYYRFMGVEINSNAYTILLSIALSVYAVYLIQGRIGKTDLILMGALMVFGAMSVSMSFILSIAAVYGFALVILSRRNPRLLMAFTLIAVLLAVIAVVLFGDSDLFQTILFRLQKSTSDDTDLSSLTTGRADIWMQYLKYFYENPMKTVFGLGLNAKLPYRPPHNYYLETVAYLGLVGALIYVLAFMSLYRPSRYTGKRTLLYQQIPLIMLLTRGLARCLICEEKLMFIFMIYTLSALDPGDSGSAELEMNSNGPAENGPIFRRA